jgi:hypothetical protein
MTEVSVMPGRARAETVGWLALAAGLAVVLYVAVGAPSASANGRADPSPAPTAVLPATPADAPATVPSAAPFVPAAPPATPVPAHEAEAALTARVRALVDADPAAAVSEVDEGARRFPDGARADERSFLKMRALVNLGRIAAARDEAEAFFARHPGSAWGERAYRLTGVHPRPPPFGGGR